MAYVYEHRVRYRECDPMGVVYHAHYIDYFEAARTEALRTMGLPYKALEDSGLFMPVVAVEVQYKQPALYDDLLHIHTWFDEAPRVRVPVRYAVTRAEEDAVLATGLVTLCIMDRTRHRPVSAPPRVLDAYTHFVETYGAAP
ncbi:MAG: thioesterase family protein [Bacteroidota bacterium]